MCTKIIVSSVFHRHLGSKGLRGPVCWRRYCETMTAMEGLDDLGLCSNLESRDQDAVMATFFAMLSVGFSCWFMHLIITQVGMYFV